MDYDKLSKEELIANIQELEILNRQLLDEKEEEIWLDHTWTGNLGHWYWNIKTNGVVFNPLILTSLGYQKEELPEKTTYEFFMHLLQPDERQQAMDTIAEHLEGKTHFYEADCRVRAKDESPRWYHFRGRIVRYEETGAPLLFAGMVFDITDKKEPQVPDMGQKDREETSPAEDLKKLNDKHALFDHLENEIASVKRLDDALSIVLFEIDENQHSGQAGETAEAAILEETAALLLGSIRDSDYAGRYGQKSFLIIYSWTGLKDAYVISERIRKKIEGHFFQSGSGISVSGGVCEYRGEKTQEFIQAAEAKLSAAKEQGGNQIV